MLPALESACGCAPGFVFRTVAYPRAPSDGRGLCCSAFGLSAAALATEVSCYACTVAYGIRKGYAITLWGSELACWLQDATLLALVARLRGARIPAMTAICVGWIALKSVLFTELVPMWFLAKFQVRSRPSTSRCV